MSPSQHTAGSIPAKRSLFKKPSWSKPQALSIGVDLFHRSTQTYIDVAAEAERQRKGKLAKKERQRARRAESEKRSGRRQRVSESEEDDTSGTEEERDLPREENANTSSNGPQGVNGSPVLSLPKLRASPKSLLKRYEASVGANKPKLEQTQKSSASNIINLENEVEVREVTEKETNFKIATPKSSTRSTEDEKSASDEEFPELARQVRERARRKRLEEDVALMTPDPRPISQDQIFPQSEHIDQSTPPPPPSDPILQILITSSIPATTPLIVNRKLSQRLKDVKLAWVERQHFTTETADKVFLTWRGKRLFDVTTCRSLGLSDGPKDRILATGDSVLDDEGRIHMEAMTAETLEAYKKAKTSEPLTRNEGLVEETVTMDPKQEAQIRIICKAKGFADFKLIVKPSTLIAKICNAFRSQNHISAEKDMYLMFDGERLPLESKVGDTELGDMDTLDVLVK